MRISKTTFVALAGLAACALTTTGVLRAEASAPGKAVVWPAGGLMWTESSVAKGARIAVLWGDPKTGPYGALKSIPGGSSLPLHTHTNDQKIVVVAGTIALSIEKGTSKDLGAGSYAFIPGGVEHTADCKSGAECMYFEEQQGASDIKFVAKPAPAK